MEPSRLFLAFLNKFISLSEVEFNERILPYTQVRQFKKKEIITQAGEVENYINFIAKGLVRKYFKKENDEIITQISRENQIVYSQESFYGRTLSNYFLESIESTTLLSITYDDLNTIFSAGASMERMGRLIVTSMMLLSERWQTILLKLTPRERFLSFVQNNAELIQRVPQKYLASLLNIQPETFSRFKHLLKQNSGNNSGTLREGPAYKSPQFIV